VIVLRILLNKARCRNCGEILESSHYSELYTYCKCGKIAVNGGREAIMRLGHHIHIEEMSEKNYFEYE